MLAGSIVAIVTPFAKDGSLDEPALRDLVEWQIACGSHGIVACGTTGETPTLTDEERLAVWRAVVETTRGRVPVVCGAGTNDTRRTVDACRAVREVGGDAALVVIPYYNKPGQAGLVAHFRAAAGAGVPVVLYDVPGRTGTRFSVETVAELAQVEGIVALKDATADLAHASEVHARCGDRLTLLSGDDPTALPFWAAGGQGVISVTANVAPRQMAACWSAFEAGDLARARSLHEALMPLHRALFLEANPIPVKAALSLLSRCEATPRLPLTPASDETRSCLLEALTTCLDNRATQPTQPRAAR